MNRPFHQLALHLTAFSVATLFCGILASQAFAIQDVEVDSSWTERLELLETRLEEQRQKLNIPGMAIAIVKDGEVIFARGFGQRDVENNKPVTPETVFAIGSSTKAFTSTLIGMLADEGVIQFDDPVVQHVPEFSLQVDTGDQSVTIRDLLCHRTGFSRMSVLWAAGTSTRPEVVQNAANAKPTKGFRESFQYNNVMYLIAGHSAGRSANSTWEELIQSRILGPLGMNHSNTSIDVAQKDSQLSLGYRWDDDKKEYRLLPMRNLDLIGPAGAINSNVIDMAKWVKFQLAKGEVDGNRLIAEATIDETWSPQIEITGDAGYGLGWMIQKWNGKKVVEHGGNIDGFGAQVTLLPEENLGYVLLTNVTATPLQGGSIAIVFDTLLNDPTDSTEGSQTDTSGLEGVYEANFGSLKDAKLTVQSKDGALYVDVPGQTEFELKSPDEDGKWFFALTDTIAVSFLTGENGEAHAMVLHQGGLDIECPREGVERPPEVPLDELRPLLGTYRDAENSMDVEVVIYKNRLAVVIPAQGTIEFWPPDDQGVWAMRAKKENFQIRFNAGDDDKIESITLFQAGNETILPRIADADESGPVLPSVDDVLANIRAAHLPQGGAEFGHVKMTGTANFVHQGASGTTTLVFSGTDANATHIDLGKLGYIRDSFDGENGWSDSAFSPFEELSGDLLEMARLRHPLWFMGEWHENYKAPSVLRQDEWSGNDVYVVQFKGKQVPDRTLYVGVDSGLILKEDWATLMPGIGELPISIEYSDYNAAGPLMLPFRVTMKNAATGDLEISYDEAKSLTARPDYTLKPADK